MGQIQLTKREYEPKNIVYLRVSTVTQDLDNQRHGVLEFIQRKNIQPVEFREETVSGKTPVANGSRVPVWPTFTPPSSRLTAATTAAEVIPVGLSTTSTPFSALPTGNRRHPRRSLAQWPRPIRPSREPPPVRP